MSRHLARQTHIIYILFTYNMFFLYLFHGLKAIWQDGKLFHKLPGYPTAARQCQLSAVPLEAVQQATPIAFPKSIPVDLRQFTVYTQYLCACICMYIYICVFIYICMYLYIYIYDYICIYTNYIRVCVYIFLCFPLPAEWALPQTARSCAAWKSMKTSIFETARQATRLHVLQDSE